MSLAGLEVLIPGGVLGKTPQISLVFTNAALGRADYSVALTFLVAGSGQLGGDVPAGAPGWPVRVGYGTATPLVSGTPFEVPAVPSQVGLSLYVWNSSSRDYSGGGTDPGILISEMVWVYTSVLTGKIANTRTSFNGPRSY